MRKKIRFTLKNRILFFLLSMIVFTMFFMLYLFTTFKIEWVQTSNLFNSPILLLGILTMVLILFFMLIIMLVNKYIFIPISEMKKAAEQIKTGNLNYAIEPVGNNEIAEFCNEFDKMRLRLRESIAEQNEIERQRKLLIASISHDLRTPLTSIKGYVEALQDGIVTDPKAISDYLQTINEKTDLLNHLIDDLSVYSKQDVGQFSLNLERIHTGKMLNNYLDHKKSEFSQGIELRLKKPFIATFIMGDPYRIIQILENLIGNARKYANSYVEVRTEVKNYHLKIHICDDGEGIPQDLLQNIFDPFFMVNKKKDQREKKGTGLGLSIVKQLAEAHQGNISVESILGKGTCFTLDIPLDH